MEITIGSLKELKVFGLKLGSFLHGGEVIELVGDVGAGKTALVKAIALGMGVVDDVNSPSYTLSQVYQSAQGLRLVHYDFYRLSDPGIMANDLREALTDPGTVVAIEWGGIVAGVLPSDHLRITIVPTGETTRRITLVASGESSERILEKLSDSSR